MASVGALTQDPEGTILTPGMLKKLKRAHVDLVCQMNSLIKFSGFTKIIQLGVQKELTELTVDFISGLKQHLRIRMKQIFIIHV